MSWFARLLCCLTLILASVPVRAETCSAAVSDMNFGDYSPIANVTAAVSGTITVSCTWNFITLTPAVFVCLSFNAVAPRTLVNGSNLLAYDLFLDAAHTTPWGSGSAALSVTLNNSNGTASAVLPFYGQVAKNQTLVPSVGNISTDYTAAAGAAMGTVAANFYLLINNKSTCLTNTAQANTFAFSVLKASIVNNCNITATDIVFGTSGVLQTQLTKNGGITVQCTNGDAFKVALSSGNSGSQLLRTMRGASATANVNYQMYTDATLKTIWGDGTGGTGTVNSTGTGAQQTFPVYGVVPPQSTAAAGNYSDTITATISF